MRKTMLTGLLLVVAAVLTVLVSTWLDLELDSTVVLGVSAGAVLALVPDVTPSRRIAGFLLGVAASVIAYLVRAGYTPDTATGRAVYVGLAIALCLVVALASAARLPLWSALLGAGTFAGAFEATYSAAPPRVVENSPGGVTTLLLCVAIGFLAAGVGAAADAGRRAAHGKSAEDEDTTTDEQMETAK